MHLMLIAVLSAAPVIHTVTASPEGLSVNGYLVEGAKGVVAIDSALTVSDGKALRQKLDEIGKPLLAVLLTHGHPDHYNGIASLAGTTKVKIYATAAVKKVVVDNDEAKNQHWKPVFKEQWPATRMFPTDEVKDKQRLSFDGMTFTVHELGPGESHADSYWILEGPTPVAFIGDLVLNGSHAYTNDGHTAAWIKSLARLQRELKTIKQLMPGHGPAGDASILAWQIAYLTKYRSEAERLRAGQAKMSDEGKKTLEAQMKAAYPTAGNLFMIALGADTVAAELAAEKK
jgi:glyoxylase-like metal-dependent hydrolase (beta-lactamase superfamily II)